MRTAWLAAALILSGCGGNAKAVDGEIHIVAGSVPLDKGPDGNSIFIDAPDGLILVDTGRHPAHSARIIAYAREQDRPIAAILNTHWHLDRTTGNWDIRQAYPQAEVYATTAIEGALVGFLNRNRAEGDRMLADPAVPEDRKAQMRRARSVVDNPDRLRATKPMLKSGTVNIAGRNLELHVAPFAATEADLWIYDPTTRTAIVGDLVVDIVPFMDTACPEGWQKALGEVAATDFKTLIPGHGPALDRTRFTAWKSAFDRFVECGRSTVDSKDCAAGWMRDAAGFIPDSHRDYARSAAEYYVDTRFRSSPEEQQRYCRTLFG